MALISYYNQPEYSSTIDLDQSPYVKAHTFEIEVTTADDDKEAMNSFLDGNNKITGIIEEMPEMSYSTTWGDSPAAVVNEKIKKFTQNKWIKMFAWQNGDYKLPLLTDSWTQQFPKAAEPLSISMKFRAYPIDGYYNTTLFNDIIKLFVFVTTPQEFNLVDTMAYMKTSGKQAEMQGGKLANIMNNLKNNISNGDIDFSDLAHVIKTGESTSSNTETSHLLKELKNLTTFVEELGNMNGETVGGCPLIKLKISDFIYPSSKIKWILKSWSFKPALQVTFDNNPIYVDFNVTLQTQYILSSTDFMALLGIEPTA